MLGGFGEQLGQLGIETMVVDKWNGKAGNVDPRLISEAYRLLFIEKKAPSNLVLVSGDRVRTHARRLRASNAKTSEILR